MELAARVKTLIQTSTQRICRAWGRGVRPWRLSVTGAGSMMNLVLWTRDCGRQQLPSQMMSTIRD